MDNKPVDPGKRRRGGPRTSEGKRRASLNALKHGRYARSIFVLRHEDQAAFERLVDLISRAFLPQNEFEYHLVRQLAAIEWRLQRVLALDSSLLDTEFAATDAAFAQHGLAPRPEVKLGAATHQLLESSRLPYYLANRESQLLYARSQILATLRQVRKGGTPTLPCSQIIDRMDVNPESSFQFELETDASATPSQPEENTPLPGETELPEAA